MKNHVLGITGSLIPYYKELNTYIGSVTATILMTQLEYWFSKMGGKQFFKFLNYLSSGFLGNQLSQFLEMDKVNLQRLRM